MQLDILVRQDSEVPRVHRALQDIPDFKDQLVTQDHPGYRVSQAVLDKLVRLDHKAPLEARVMLDRRVSLERLEMLELLVQ